MIWADKIALSAAVVLFVPIFLLGVFAEGWGSANPLMGATFAILYTAVPMWIVLRALDLISGGPQRRRINAHYFR